MNFEVIIIGGSYAGLSAAMALGRSLRKVLIIDSGMPCNRQTPHSHNFLTHDGQKPAVIREKAKSEISNYKTVTTLDDLAIAGKKIDGGFSITTQSGKEFSAKKIIFATGIKDQMPDIKGFSECWGITVVHCPYCHGYEIRGQKTGIMANGAKAMHVASLVNNLTNDITLLTNGKPDLNEEQINKLKKHNITIIENTISEVKHNNGNINSVIFKDGSKLDLSAMYAAIPFIQHSDIPASLGCELNEHGYVKIDNLQKTTVAGVYACGDNAAMMRSVANAVFAGNLTGALVNKDLTDESF